MNVTSDPIPFFGGLVVNCLPLIRLSAAARSPYLLQFPPKCVGVSRCLAPPVLPYGWCSYARIVSLTCLRCWSMTAARRCPGCQGHFPPFWTDCKLKRSVLHVTVISHHQREPGVAPKCEALRPQRSMTSLRKHARLRPLQARGNPLTETNTRSLRCLEELTWQD